MARDQENRYEILRVTAAAEAETLEAARVAASVMLEEDDDGVEYLIVDREGSRAELATGRAVGFHPVRAGLLDERGVILSRREASR